MSSVDVKSVEFEIPGLTPPSVNHYKMPVTMRTRQGPVKGYAITPEAKAFQDAVAIFARGRTVMPASAGDRKKVAYRVDVVIALGDGVRLDVDNGNKVLLDGLQKAGVIHSDARVKQLTVEMIWDERENPRTHVTVRVLEG